MNEAVPAKYENKWAVSIFAEWQWLREVKVPVLDCGGLFSDYDLHEVTALSEDNGRSVAELLVVKICDEGTCS